MSGRWGIRAVVGGMSFFLAASVASACGPFFPNRVLLEGDHLVLGAPMASFAQEIKRIKPAVPAYFVAIIPSEAAEHRLYKADLERKPKGRRRQYSYRDRYGRQTAAADVADLKRALAGRSLSKGKCDRILADYRAVRNALLEHSMAVTDWRDRVRGWRYRTKADDSGAPSRPKFNAPDIPKGLPAEFADYLRGAILFHSGEMERARKVWRGLLKRPKKKRFYRSTWAAFMIGKTLLDEKPDEAVKWFQEVRRLSGEGYVDSLGLAASCLGWEARAYLDRQQYNRAIELYVAQLATGDPTAMASLRFTTARVLNSEPEVLEKLAGNNTARKVLTAYMLSYRLSTHTSLRTKWLEAIERAGINAVEEADRFAWAAYQCGEYETAKRWTEAASEASDMARWIRVKLLLRAGKVDEAAEQLAVLVRKYPESQTPRPWGEHYIGCECDLAHFSVGECMRGELGVLQVARGQYVEAIDVLIRGGYWEDAAYVAERVLTPDELINYVNLKWPAVQADWPDESYMRPQSRNPNWFVVRMRYLLGRRLTRLGRWKEARRYYPTKWRQRFDVFVGQVERGQDTGLPRKERATALWKAACIARYEGMELMGTEVEPDWFYHHSGTFTRRGFSAIRSLPDPKEAFASSPDERERLRRNPVPEKRFHYHYVAADYAWRAAELMPDGSDETARVLCIAGSWLKDQDPYAADRFYKAMVVRCRNTRLGQEADKLRWFPKVEVNMEELLK